MASRGVIVGGLDSAIRFLGPAWKGAWGAMIAATLLFAAVWASGLLAAGSRWRLEALAALIAAGVVVQGGLYRLALSAGRPGPAGLQWSAAETRLSAVWALSTLFIAMLGLLVFITALVSAFAVATAGRGFVMAEPMTWAGAVDGRGRAVLAVIAILGAVFLLWGAARISLGPAATVAQGRVQVLASWPHTRGRALAIIAGRTLLAAAPVGGAILILRLASGHSASPLTAWGAGLAAGGALAGLWLPLGVGLMAYLYRQGPTSRAEDDLR
jgi:hypothetical protein